MLLLSTTALHCCSCPDTVHTGLECVHELETLWLEVLFHLCLQVAAVVVGVVL